LLLQQKGRLKKNLSLGVFCPNPGEVTLAGTPLLLPKFPPNPDDVTDAGTPCAIATEQSTNVTVNIARGNQRRILK
jgi:hypothetical protein